MKPSESPLDPKAKLRRWFQLGVFGTILIGIVTAGAVWGPALWRLLSDKDEFKRWIESYGDYAALVFILVQFIQVVVFFIPGEITQIAGGYIFGTWWGLVYSYIGITAGSLTAFYLARWFERIVLDLLVDPETLKQFDRLVYGKAGVVPMFILFFIPAIPKDLLCYVCGLTPMHVLVFLAISTIGRFPGIMMSSMFGEAVQEQNWMRGVFLAAASVVPAVAVYFLRGPIERFRKKYLVTEEERIMLAPDPPPPAYPVKPTDGKPGAAGTDKPTGASAAAPTPPAPDPAADKAAPMDKDSV